MKEEESWWWGKQEWLRSDKGGSRGSSKNYRDLSFFFLYTETWLETPQGRGVWDTSNCVKHPTLTCRLTKTPRPQDQLPSHTDLKSTVEIMFIKKLNNWELRHMKSINKCLLLLKTKQETRKQTLKGSVLGGDVYVIIPLKTCGRLRTKTDPDLNLIHPVHSCKIRLYWFNVSKSLSCIFSCKLSNWRMLFFSINSRGVTILWIHDSIGL